jgi:hypothetical protein
VICVLNEKKLFGLVRKTSKNGETSVSKYFDVWANVIIPTQKSYPALSSGKIAYIDLFAGLGRYDDGAQSTPIKILNPSYKLVAPPLHEPPRDSTRTYRNTSWA